MTQEVVVVEGELIAVVAGAGAAVAEEVSEGLHRSTGYRWTKGGALFEVSSGGSSLSHKLVCSTPLPPVILKSIASKCCTLDVVRPCTPLAYQVLFQM